MTVAVGGVRDRRCERIGEALPESALGRHTEVVERDSRRDEREQHLRVPGDLGDVDPEVVERNL